MCTHRGILEDRQVLQDVVLDLGCVVGADPVLCRAAHKALGAVLILLPGLVPTDLAVYVGQVHQQVTVGALHSDWDTQLVTGGVSRGQQNAAGALHKVQSPLCETCRVPMIVMLGTCSRYA